MKKENKCVLHLPRLLTFATQMSDSKSQYLHLHCKCKKHSIAMQLRKSKDAQKFTNLLMTNGDKGKAYKIFLNGISVCKSKSFEERKTRVTSDQICVKTISNIEPIVETRKVKVRGNNYQVPWCTNNLRRKRTAINWFVLNAKNKKQASTRNHVFSKANQSVKKRTLQTVFPMLLGQELCDSFYNQGSNIQKRSGIYAIAAHNRAYARYRWW